MDGETGNKPGDSVETIAAWQCIGCGRIDSPQTCIGVCEYRRTALVDADTHAKTRAALDAATRERDALLAFVRRLAFSHPRNGAWERSYRTLQEQAQRLLEKEPASHP